MPDFSSFDLCTLADPRLLPAYGLIQNWNRIGRRLTNRAVTGIAAGGAAEPIVLPEIQIGNIIYWFKKNYTTVQRALNLVILFKGIDLSMPIIRI